MTAAFTLNALSHVNSVAGLDFDERGWRHCVEYEREAMRIVTFLEAVAPQRVSLLPSEVGAAGGREVRSFAAGERIFVEQSRKFNRVLMQRLAESAGLVLTRCWGDDDYLVVELRNGAT